MAVHQLMFGKLRLMVPLRIHPLAGSEKIRGEREMLQSMGLPL